MRTILREFAVAHQAHARRTRSCATDPIDGHWFGRAGEQREHHEENQHRGEPPDGAVNADPASGRTPGE